MTQQPQPPSPYQPPAAGGAFPGYQQPGYAHPYPYGAGAGYGYGDPMEPVLAPARRAAVLQIIIASLLVLGSFCIGIMGLAWDKLVQSEPSLSAQMGNVDPDLMRIGFLVLAGVVLLLGIGLIGLAVFMRKGGKGSILTSLVLTLLLEGYFAINLLSVAPRLGSFQGPQLMGAACASMVPPVVLLVLIIFQIQALLRSGQVTAAARYGQYWQYQQQQQPPQPAPPGYGFPPPPTPPPPPQQQQSPPGASGYPPPPPPGAGPV